MEILLTDGANRKTIEVPDDTRNDVQVEVANPHNHRLVLSARFVRETPKDAAGIPVFAFVSGQHLPPSWWSKQA